MDILSTLLYLLQFLSGLIGLSQNIFGSQESPSATTKPADPIYFPNPCPDGYFGQNCAIECGVSFHQQNIEKIVGGVEAVPHSWPAQIRLSFKFSGNVFIKEINKTVHTSLGSLCGGTLIDVDLVLTAAHCFMDSIPATYDYIDYDVPIQYNPNYPTYESLYTVYLGVHNYSQFDPTDPSTGIKRQVEFISIHKNYDNVTKLNDIALIKLKQPVVLNKNIQIACLPFNEPITYPQYVQDAWVVGWGMDYFIFGDISEVLKNTKIQIQSPGYCDTYQNTDWTRQICAGYLPGGQDTCQGDSGGPLYIKSMLGGKKKFVTSGVVSYGTGCGYSDTPGVYTRNVYYLHWILRHTSFGTQDD